MITQQHNGFTLIEILVAVAILGVVASIAIPVYSGYTQSARATECANEVAAIRLAEEEYFLVNNLYFGGDGATAIATASAGVYVPSPVATTAAAVCDYKVTLTGTTRYAINAVPKAGGALASTSLNLNTCNYAPCP